VSDLVALIPEVPKGVREAAQRGILIPFIGAGVSRIAGCPGWEQFANGALEWLIANGQFSYSQLDQIRQLNPRVKLSLARALERDNNLSIGFRGLLHPTNRVGNEKGVRLYDSLFRLGKTFVTTNYDEWLDERIPLNVASAAPDPTAKDSAGIEQIRVIHKVEELLPAALNQPNTVIHLHGSLRDPKRMVLTTLDYLQHYANDRMSGDPYVENRVLTFLDHLFRHRTVLFIGYGLDELEILEYVILKARPHASTAQEARHFILQGFFSHETELVRSMKTYYLEFGIQLIPFLRDSKNWDQLIDVLEEFARVAAYFCSDSLNSSAAVIPYCSLWTRRIAKCHAAGSIKFSADADSSVKTRTRRRFVRKSNPHCSSTKRRLANPMRK